MLTLTQNSTFRAVLKFMLFRSSSNFMLSSDKMLPALIFARNWQKLHKTQKRNWLMITCFLGFCLLIRLHHLPDMRTHLLIRALKLCIDFKYFPLKKRSFFMAEFLDLPLVIEKINLSCKVYC